MNKITIKFGIELKPTKHIVVNYNFTYTKKGEVIEGKALETVDKEEVEELHKRVEIQRSKGGDCKVIIYNYVLCWL